MFDDYVNQIQREKNNESDETPAESTRIGQSTASRSIVNPD